MCCEQTTHATESTAIADAIKAEIARAGITGKKVVALIGRDRNYVYQRLRYEKPFDTNDIALIAEVLGISTKDIFRSAQFGMTIKDHQLTA